MHFCFLRACYIFCSSVPPLELREGSSVPSLSRSGTLAVFAVFGLGTDSSSLQVDRRIILY